MSDSLEDLIDKKPAQEDTPTPDTDVQDVKEDVGSGPSIREFLSENQFSISEDIDENTLRKQVAQRLHQAVQHEQQIREMQQELERLRTSQETPPPPNPPAQAQAPSPVPVLPPQPTQEEVDIWAKSFAISPADISLTRRNEAGLFEPRDNSETARRAADAMNQAASLAGERMHKFVSNPMEFGNYIKEQILSEIREQVKPEVDVDSIVTKAAEALQKRQQEAQREQEIESFYRDHEKDLLKHDANGNPLTDPFSGDVLKTELGYRFRDALQTLRENGMEELAAIQTAWKFLSSPPPTPPSPPAAAQPPQPEPVPGDNKQRFLDRETPLPEQPSINRSPGRPAPRNGVPSLTALIESRADNI